tara:strand:- start:2301 stop:2582 length:282 start_codon:yes stop_codon:yes gene_type:complete
MNQEIGIKQEVLDGLIVKQAVRDVASKDTKTSDEALLYFVSDDFSNLCKRNSILSEGIVHSVKELNTYPVLSKKKLAEDVCKLVDSFFGLGSK